jgi:hypothetical protein
LKPFTRAIPTFVPRALPVRARGGSRRRQAGSGARSHDTALRDIKDLIERGALEQETGGGRSTSYALVQTVSGDAR